MNAESRRPVEATGSQKSTAAADSSIVTLTTDERPSLSRAEVYRIIRGRLAAHVITKDRDSRFTCRSYVNLRAAERAVKRAHDRGCAATVVMVRQDVAPLVPGPSGDAR